jgi:hypothetical protein
MPDSRITDEQRHLDALDYIARQRTRTLDAGPEPGSEIHLHLHNAGSPASPMPASARPATTPPAARSGKLVGDQEPEEPAEEEEAEQVLGSLPAPEPGYVYRLEPRPDGTVALTLALDDGGEIRANTGDNLRSWSDAQTRSILQRMNKANRAAHTLDAATKTQTIMRHGPLLPGEKLEIRGPSEGGLYDLVLISSTDPDIAGEIPRGAEDLPADGDHEEDDRNLVNEVSAPAAGELRMKRSVDRRMTDPARLRSMNAQAKAFWQGRGAA